MSGRSGLLVVQVVDSFTAGPPVDARLVVSVEGVLGKPLRKPNGMHVFQRVPDGAYRVRVLSELYHAEELLISTDDLDGDEPVVVVPVSPSSAYPFRDSATLLRASVRDEQGRPLGGVAVRALVTAETGTRARLGQATEAGCREAVLSRVVSRMRAGERFGVWSEGAEVEVATVHAFAEESRRCSFAAPLEQGHLRGAQLTPAVLTESDARGEVVVAFGRAPAKEFVVQLSFVSGSRKLIKEVSVGEGETQAMGVVKFEQA